MHEPEDVMHEPEDVHKMHEPEDVHKMHEPEDVQFDDSSTGFNIMLQIVTAKFLTRMQAVTLSDWHDETAEKDFGLDELPRFSHQVLPLLCCNPLKGAEMRLQVRVPVPW